MTGLPAVTVKLDDGTGAFPYDVTAVARLPESLSWTRGRGDEHSDNQPGSVAITFDNSDAAFTLGRVNLQPNPSFESAFTTGGQVGTPARWSFDAATFLTGARSIKVAPLGGDVGNLGFQADMVAATPGIAYVGSLYAKRAAGAGTIRVDVQWLNAALGSLGSASTVVDLDATSAPIGSWVRAASSGVAPATTAWARVRAFYTSYVGGTDVANFDLAQLEVGVAPSFLVFNDQGIRLLVNGQARWTTRVQNWPVAWPEGDDTFAVSAATAIDVLATLARQKLRSALLQELLEDAPVVLYPFGEGQGATQAADIAGGRPSLVSSSGFVLGAMPTFGAETGLPDGSSGAQFAAANVNLVSNPALVSGSSVRLTLVFESNAGTNSLTLCQIQTSAGFKNLTVQSTGVGGFVSLQGVSPSVGANLHDGKRHIVTVQVDATSVDTWIDGVKTSTAGVALTWFHDSVNVTPGQGGLTGGETVVVADLSTGPKISDARISAYHLAALTDLTNETPATRIARVLGYSNVLPGTIDTAGDTILGPAGQDGMSVLDVLNEIATADFGDVFGDANGKVSYVAGTTIAGRTVPVVFDANWIDEQTRVEGDMFGVVNDATGKASSRQNVFRVANQSSIGPPGNHGSYPDDLEWNVSTDAQALDRVNWTVGTYSVPRPRVTQLVLDLLSMDAPTLAAAMTLDLTSFLRASGMPIQTPAGTTLDVLVESITETIQAGGSEPVWSLTFNVSMQSARSAWVLGDAVYGVLGVTTKLYV